MSKTIPSTNCAQRAYAAALKFRQTDSFERDVEKCYQSLLGKIDHLSEKGLMECEVECLTEDMKKGTERLRGNGFLVLPYSTGKWKVSWELMKS